MYTDCLKTYSIGLCDSKKPIVNITESDWLSVDPAIGHCSGYALPKGLLNLAQSTSQTKTDHCMDGLCELSDVNYIFKHFIKHATIKPQISSFS